MHFFRNVIRETVVAVGCLMISALVCSCSGPLFHSEKNIQNVDIPKTNRTQTVVLEARPRPLEVDTPTPRPAMSGAKDSDDDRDNITPPLDSPNPHNDIEMPIEEDIQLESTTKALLDDCGASSVIRNNPDEVYFRRKVSGSPFNTTRNGVTSKLRMTSEWEVSPGIYKHHVLMKVIQLVNAEGANATKIAETNAQDRSGEIKFTTIPLREMYAFVDQNKDWSKVFCSIVPASQVEIKRASISTVVTFNPALPVMLSPMANAKRYLEEIGDRRDFRAITATIVSSNDPILKDKSTVIGNVTISKVGPVFKSDTATINGDIGFQIQIDFGSTEITSALGLVPSSTYFLVFSRKAYAGSIVQTRIAGEDPVIFVD